MVEDNFFFLDEGVVPRNSSPSSLEAKISSSLHYFLSRSQQEHAKKNLPHES